MVLKKIIPFYAFISDGSTETENRYFRKKPAKISLILGSRELQNRLENLLL